MCDDTNFDLIIKQQAQITDLQGKLVTANSRIDTLKATIVELKQYAILSEKYQKMVNEGRPLCKQCQIRPAAINYTKNGVVHYRSQCNVCRKGKTGRKPVPNWQLSGYKKKSYCEQCGFKAMDHRQLQVLYVDGNMKNNSWTNLKTVCSNCAIEFSIKGFGNLSERGIQPDF